MTLKASFLERGIMTVAAWRSKNVGYENNMNISNKAS
jgi:hypothetical protein